LSVTEPIAPDSGRALARRLQGGRKLLLGVIHLRPLPGSPLWSPNGDGGPLDGVIAAARADAETILAAGFDGFVVENFGDVPFHGGAVPPWVVASMTRVADELPTADAFTVANVLRNDALAGLSVALASGLDAIRVNVHSGAMVTDQGIVEGRAADTMRRRRELAPNVAILADVDVKHAAPLGAPRTLGDLAKDTAYRGLADALIVTGAATGAATATADVEAVKTAVPDRPLLVGSGADADNVADLLRIADGVIVASGLKPDRDVRRPIDRDLAAAFVTAARSVK